MLRPQAQPKSCLKDHWRLFGAAALLCLSGGGAVGADFEGIQSPYTQPLGQVLREWPENGADSAPSPSSVQVECYEVAGNRLYIGVRQILTISAPLAAVRSVIEGFSHYPRLFDGLLKSEIREREGSRFLVYTEQEIPVPFVSNEKTEMLYSVDESRNGRVIYRYQLKKSRHMKYNDGAVILQARPGGGVRYTEFDFWDADWGFLAALGAGRIWRDSIRGLVQSDLAIRFRAEHPEWKPEKILEQSKQEAGKFPVDDCLASKKTFSGRSATSSGEPAPQPAPSP